MKPSKTAMQAPPFEAEEPAVVAGMPSEGF